MKVIADSETSGVFTKCLAIDWRLPKICQVKDCRNETFAVVCFSAEESPDGKPATITICKEHHEKARAENKFHYTIEFNKGEKLNV